MQRKTSASRRDSIKAYIQDRLFPASDLIGGFPAICIASQYPITSEEIDPKFPGVVNMLIDTGYHNKRVALDGLGRISGALALVDAALSGELPQGESDEMLEVLRELSMPCVFYSPKPGQSPLSPEELGQLFHDFNFKVTPVSAKDAIALDGSDPYIRATYFLAKHAHFIAKFGMDTRSASLGSKSKAIVVQPVLLRFVRAALEGSKYVESARNVEIESPKLTSNKSAQVLGSLAEFIDDFAEAMGDQWSNRDSVHLSSAGCQAIAIIYHDIAFLLKDVNRKAFAKALATKINWDRDADLWRDIVTKKKDSKTGEESLAFLGAGVTTRCKMVEIIRDTMGINAKLQELGDAQD